MTSLLLPCLKVTTNLWRHERQKQHTTAVHCVCSPESRQGSPNPRGNGPGLEALAQLASPASSRPQTVGGRSQTSALAQLADVESSSWGPKGGAQAHSKYGSFSADLDFDEFLERQQRFLEVCVCHSEYGCQKPSINSVQCLSVLLNAVVDAFPGETPLPPCSLLLQEAHAHAVTSA